MNKVNNADDQVFVAKKEWQAPSIQQPAYHPLSKAETEEIEGSAGLAVGVCVGLGYSCAATGGFGAGICFLPGYSSYGGTPTPPAPPPPPVTPPPVPVTPPTPPVAATPPTMSFIQAPDVVLTTTTTKLTFYAELAGFPYREEEFTFEINVPNQAGVMTKLLGITTAGPWAPVDGKIISSMKTSRRNFTEVRAGQVVIDIYIEHETPDGDPPDCTFKATHSPTNTTIQHPFKGKAPP